MADGWHYYKCKVGKEPTRLKTITTASQARGKAEVFPSVTSVLSLLPNPFINQWRGRKMVELKEEDPSRSMEELEQLVWGVRECPETGETISSSEFGTKAHAAIELHFTDNECLPNSYSPIAEQTIDYLEQNFTFAYAEKVLVDHDLRIAGTVDYIGQDKDGKWMLADFKFRDIKEGKKPSYYAKDKAQLAIEGEMWRTAMNLDYSPDLYSIVVDSNTGKCFPKKWSEKMRQQGIRMATQAAQLYWGLDEYGYVDNEQN